MNSVLAGLGLVGAGTLLLPFFSLRANRTATGEGLRLATALPAAAWAAGLLLAAACFALAAASARRRAPALSFGALGDISSGSGRGPRLLAGALALLPGPLLLAALGAGSASLARGAPEAARVSFGGGFWAAAVGAWILGRGASRLPGLPAAFAARLPRLALGASIAAGAILALLGGFGALALARELANRREAFLGAATRHLAYALFPTLAAALLALPLGRAAARSAAVERPLFFVATTAQTVPTLSLLGLLVLPLSALGAAVPALGAIGLRGVGWAPASIALFLYALLPLAANARAGFALVPEAVRDAARGLGMGRRELFLRVELPLAAPALVAGFRIAFAQNLGNAVLAGLIGGGGLGGLVFLGLAQAAPDLVLLGSLPVVAAAFAADRLLGAAEREAARRTGLGARDETRPGQAEAVA